MTKEKIIEEVEKCRQKNEKISMKKIVEIATKHNISMPSIISLLLKKGLMCYVKS